MKRSTQSGFALVELVILVVILAALAGTGFYVWHKDKKNSVSVPTTSSSYQSPPLTTPTAPKITNASDLNSAMQALNQTHLTSSNTDNSQLSSEANGF